jgi:C-terminal processing protease CtpA/Prc
VKKLIPILSLLLFFVSYCAYLTPSAYGQGVQPKHADSNPAAMRDMFFEWLDAMKDAVKEEYYDPKYHGIQLNARFDAAKAQINSLDYDWQMFRVLVALLMEFDDSHTYVVLPPRKDHYDYGFDMQMVGADCLITAVKKDSDAEKAGLEVGDKIVRIGEIKPDRDSLWKLFYVLYQLAPTEFLELTVKKENAPEKTIKDNAIITTRKEYLEERKKRKDKEKTDPIKCTEISKEIIACKLYTFDAEKSDVDKMMKGVAGYTKLMLDLRGNGGGLVTTEEYLTGYFFDHDVKMLDLRGRKKTEARIAKSKGKKAFNGELAVLIDSQSASASEVFARVVQLEKRGKVIGDVSSGSVMTSLPIALLRYKQRFGYTTKVFPLFISLSIGDVVMSDGGRLEKKGVVPDIPIVPTGYNLKARLDPVLAAASTMLGYKLSPEDAGKMHFMKETPNDLFEVDNTQSEKP